MRPKKTIPTATSHNENVEENRKRSVNNSKYKARMICISYYVRYSLRSQIVVNKNVLLIELYVIFAENGKPELVELQNATCIHGVAEC